MSIANEMDSGSEPALLVRPPMPADVPWPNVSPLTGHPLAEELDVPGHLQWIEDFATKYELTQSDRRHDYEKLRRRILDRERESRLFLGVIGEFSSGKSTLVNALIRERLLRSDVLQGTTAAVTLISYGPELTVDVRRKVEGALTVAAAGLSGGSSRDELLALIHRATSEEAFGRDVVQVDVRLQSPSLQTGIVIVDTPGPNAVQARHGEATGAAIRQLCDAAIIVMPANEAGSESLFDYLRLHAADILHRCIFLITKVDLLRRERDRTLLLDNLRSRLTHQLGVSNPRVLAAAPQFVVEHLRISDPTTLPIESTESEESYSPQEIQEWLQHFEKVEQELHGLLTEKRLQAQADDVARSLDLLYAELQSTLEARLQSYRQRHDVLAALVIPDIDAFVAQKHDHHFLQASRRIMRDLRSLTDDLQEIYDGFLGDLRSVIEDADDVDALKAAVENVLPGKLRRGQYRIQGHVEEVMNEIESTVRAELTAFHDDFQKQYQSLATLGGELEIDDRGAGDAAGRLGYASRAASTEIAATLQAFNNTRSENSVGGGAIGAVVGTFVFPGVGTLLGAALGTFISSLFGPSLYEVKSKSWDDLYAAVVPQLDESHLKIIHSLCTSAEEAVATLGRTITEYGPKYQALVRQMQQRDADERRELLLNKQAIEQDLYRIAARKQALEKISERIREL